MEGGKELPGALPHYHALYLSTSLSICLQRTIKNFIFLVMFTSENLNFWTFLDVNKIMKLLVVTLMRKEQPSNYNYLSNSWAAVPAYTFPLLLYSQE